MIAICLADRRSWAIRTSARGKRDRCPCPPTRAQLELRSSEAALGAAAGLGSRSFPSGVCTEIGNTRCDVASLPYHSRGCLTDRITQSARTSELLAQVLMLLSDMGWCPQGCMCRFTCANSKTQGGDRPVALLCTHVSNRASCHHPHGTARTDMPVEVTEAACGAMCVAHSGVLMTLKPATNSNELAGRPRRT